MQIGIFPTCQLKNSSIFFLNFGFTGKREEEFVGFNRERKEKLKLMSNDDDDDEGKMVWWK